MAVADVTAREVAPTGGEIAGVNIALDGTGDNEAPCYINGELQSPNCDGVSRNAAGMIGNKWNNYTMEVVQQIGSDSFYPGHGVLISKTKNGNSSCGTYTCFVWVVDAHPEDINQVDFVYPDGTPKKATVGDERQKNDARSTPASARAPRTSTRTPRTACTSTSSTSAPTRRASCTTPSA